MKRIARFAVAHAVSAEEAERHYLDVHHRFARSCFRTATGIERYVTQRATAQYDVNGRFLERPKAWRFVITHTLDAGDLASSTDWLPKEVTDEIWRDHTNFMRDLRSFEVEERCLVDRRSGQTNLAKLLFIYSLKDGAGRDEAARSYLDEHLPALTEAVAEAYGARLFLTNMVMRELESAPVEEPGQRYTGRYLESTPILAFEEYYFDNAEWAGELFARPDICGRLRRSPFLDVQGLVVEERIGVDKR
jgi:hypothetical protein